MLKVHEICQFGQFIFGKIIEIVISRSHHLKLKCTKIRLPSWIFGGSSNWEGRRGKDKDREKEKKVKGGKEGEKGRGRETTPIAISGHAAGNHKGPV